MSLFTFSQIFVGVDISRIHNLCPRYFYYFYYRLNIADSLKTINQELLRPENYISPTIPDSQKKFTELSTINISRWELHL